MPLSKACAFDQLHREIELTILFAKVVNRNNVWMIQLRRSFRFVAKSLAINRIRNSARTDQFQSDGAIQPNMSSPIDDTHSAAADFVQQQITAKRLAG